MQTQGMQGYIRPVCRSYIKGLKAGAGWCSQPWKAQKIIVWMRKFQVPLHPSGIMISQAYQHNPGVFMSSLAKCGQIRHGVIIEKRLFLGALLPATSPLACSQSSQFLFSLLIRTLDCWFYPLAPWAEGVWSCCSGRSGGWFGTLPNAYIWNHWSDFLHSKFYGHSKFMNYLALKVCNGMDICPLPPYELAHGSKTCQIWYYLGSDFVEDISLKQLDGFTPFDVLWNCYEL